MWILSGNLDVGEEKGGKYDVTVKTHYWRDGYEQGRLSPPKAMVRPPPQNGRMPPPIFDYNAP